LDNNPVSANSVGKSYRVDGSQLAKHYKNHLSNYYDWDQFDHAGEWVLYAENIGERLCLDEIALSDGELYTVLTNAKSRCQKGSLIAMIQGVKSSIICEILNKIPLGERKKVKEISVDMANNMEKIARDSFPNASIVTDRFHVAKLISEAVQEIRIKYRWEAIALENDKVKEAKAKREKYISPTFENGDTRKQLLARSRYLLFKPKKKWTESQAIRAEILFKEYPDILHAYNLSMMFRRIYETSRSIQEAEEYFDNWFEKIKQYDFPCFVTAAESIKNHKETILNFFVNRTTNALAESFNSKIKAFRNIFRGVKDIPFFIFRVTKIFA